MKGWMVLVPHAHSRRLEPTAGILKLLRKVLAWNSVGAFDRAAGWLG